jgi:hypothetical protein
MTQPKRDLSTGRFMRTAPPEKAAAARSKLSDYIGLIVFGGVAGLIIVALAVYLVR